MKPAPVTDFLLHDLVMSAAAEGAVRTAVAAAVTLDPVFAHGISLREPAGPADVDFEEVE